MASLTNVVRGWRIAAVAAILYLLPGTAFAQASLTGVVRDVSGGALPGVTVEASSDALIEKMRAAVTDGGGRYTIPDLRPGSYAVSFSIAGFKTVKREGIELSGNAAFAVNAELPVGGLEESITVTGESPIVDASNATRQRAFSTEVQAAIPNNRVPAFVVSLSPGINNTTQDVGGSEGNTARGTNLTSHGSRATDIRTNVNGLSVNPLETGSSASGVPNSMLYAEILVDSSGASAEDNLGGVTINLIPREGGNQLRGEFFTTFANDNFQGDNLTQDLIDRGLTTANRVKLIYDVNAALGGAIKKDKLWFFVTGRQTTADRYVGGAYLNANAGNPAAFTYVADTSQPAFTVNEWSVLDGRLTWQATPKNKVSFSYDISANNTPSTTTAVLAHEAASPGKQRFDTAWRAEWTAPLTNRLLFQAHYYNRRLPSFSQRPPGVPAQNLESILEQQTGLRFRAQASTFGIKINTNQAWRASLTYVAGAHNLKFGYEDGVGLRANTNIALDSPVSFRVNNGVPNQLTQVYSPDIECDLTKGCEEYIEKARQNHDMGLYAQDKWTLNRLTLSYGLRFTWYKTSFDEQHVTPSALAPALDLVLPPTEGVNWKDLTPRFGVVYALTSSGKTVVKASANKYVTGQALQGSANGNTLFFGRDLNPYNRLVLSTTRSWSDANRNFIPDCNLALPGVTGECGAMTNQAFGTLRPATAYDPDVLSGWSKRVYNWEYAVGVQHELLPRTGLEATYYRRTFGNWVTTDNRAVTPANFTKYQITAPVDPRLPNGGGYVVGGLYDLNPDKVGQVDNYITFADNLGGQTEEWNGVDVIVTSRVAGANLMGGYSTGRLSRNTCALVAQLPELLGAGGSEQYCDFKDKYINQFKLVGSYMLPKVDVQVGATYQNMPGNELNSLAANYVATNAVILPSLGRPLSGGAANVTVNLVEPGTMYSERINQFDLRFSKIFRMGGPRRLTLNFDIANAFNANTVLVQSEAYGNWLQPQEITQARFFKFGVSMDF